VLEFFGDLGEGDHLGGEKIDEERHEEALALDLFGVALAEDLFEEDALVGYVLVDDPEALFVGGEDEGVAELAERLEGGEGVEGVGLLRGCWFVCGFRGIVAHGNRVSGKGEASGGWWDDGCGEGEAPGWRRCREWDCVVWGGIVLGLDGDGVKDGLRWAVGKRANVDQEGAGGSMGAVECGGEAGGGAGLHEGGAHGVPDEVVDEAGLAEADLGLRGMDVDVDLLRRHLE
jgi:hypothetical protein